MRKIQPFLTLFLAIFFLFSCPYSVFAEYEDSSTIPSLEEQEPEPLNFDAKILLTSQGYVVSGILTGDLPPDLLEVKPVYSLDDIEYQSVILEDGSEAIWNLDSMTATEKLWSQVCLWNYTEPFSSYLDGTVLSFSLKLALTTQSGEVISTPAFQFVRTTEAINQPDDVSASMRFSSGIRMSRPPHGRYSITVLEGTTMAELLAMLPETLLMEIQLVGTDFLDTADVSLPVQWQLPDDFTLTAQEEPIIFSDAATVTPLSAGSVLNMVTGNYILRESPLFNVLFSSSEVKLAVTVLPKDAQLEASLSDQLRPDRLSLNMEIKPSGATALNIFYLADGNNEWVEIGNLLEQVSLDAVPKNHGYGIPDFLSSTQTPYREYLEKENGGFILGLEVTGGVYDGQKILLPFPGEYHFDGTIPGFGTGSGGNENNAGNGNTDGDGQRPNLPDEDITPSPSEPSEPETPSPLPEQPSPPPKEPSLELTKESDLLTESAPESLTEQPKTPQPPPISIPESPPSETVSNLIEPSEPPPPVDGEVYPPSVKKPHLEPLPPKTTAEVSSPSSSPASSSLSSVSKSSSTLETASALPKESLPEPISLETMTESVTPSRPQANKLSTTILVVLLSVGVVVTVGVGLLAGGNTKGGNALTRQLQKIVRNLFQKK